MPTPTQIAETARADESRRLYGWVESLEKCSGWREWMSPKLFGAYDAAQTAILEAHAKGEPPRATDVATFQGLHELVTSYRRTLATQKIKLANSTTST